MRYLLLPLLLGGMLLCACSQQRKTRDAMQKMSTHPISILTDSMWMWIPDSATNPSLDSAEMLLQHHLCIMKMAPIQAIRTLVESYLATKKSVLSILGMDLFLSWPARSRVSLS